MTEVVTRERVFKLMQGYRDTGLLRAAIDLGLFGALAAGPVEAPAVAQRIGADPRGTRILLDALSAIGLVQRIGERFQAAPGAGELLDPSAGPYVGHLAPILAGDAEWDALKTLSDAVRRGGTVAAENAETPGYAYWEDFAKHATFATSPLAVLIAEILGPWARDREALSVLDVACGHGIYGYTLAAAQPQARVTSVDWPNVLPHTREHAARLGVLERANFIEGDMFTVPLGGPYDVAMVTNVLHHFSEDRAVELLQRVHDALRPDSRLVVVGFTTDDETPEQDPAPYLFSVLMLVWTANGEVHSVDEYERMFKRAGFRVPMLHRLASMPLSVLIADREVP
ncbi:MAG TPA: methyltransferase [Rugosimonospora sp.]|nr:methyltransferase [Rugosimonospora sp.]